MRKEEKIHILYDIRAWWKSHPIIKFSPVERELKLGQGTLSKFINGNRSSWFPEDKIEPLIEIMRRYGYEN